MPSRTFSSFSILSHFRVCTERRKKRSSQHGPGVGKGFPGWGNRHRPRPNGAATPGTSGPGGLRVLRNDYCCHRHLLMQRERAGIEIWNAGKAFSPALGPAAISEGESHKKRKGISASASFKQLRALFKNAPVSPALWNKSPAINCNQSLGQLSVLVQFLELCWIQREQKPNQNWSLRIRFSKLGSVHYPLNWVHPLSDEGTGILQVPDKGTRLQLLWFIVYIHSPLSH